MAVDTKQTPEQWQLSGVSGIMEEYDDSLAAGEARGDGREAAFTAGR
jgi:hypothetical protein